MHSDSFKSTKRGSQVLVLLVVFIPFAVLDLCLAHSRLRFLGVFFFSKMSNDFWIMPTALSVGRKISRKLRRGCDR